MVDIVCILKQGNLLNFLNRRGYMEEDQIRVIAAQIIDCLCYLHGLGIIYGDLKAENILISKNGTVKICDFNLSGTKSVLNNALQGTICYIAPEMIEGSMRTHKSDFWSLGVLLHLLFYRKYPFKNRDGSDVLRNIMHVNLVKESRSRRASPEFRMLIKDLLTKSPRKRLGSRKEDFQQHPYFKGFSWTDYFRKRENFGYARNYNSEDDSDEGTLISSEYHSDGSSNFTESNAGSRRKIKNYNVIGFTYDAKSPCKHFKSII